MDAPNPEQAVLDALTGPPGHWEPGATSPGGIQSGFVRGGNPFHADPSTIRVVKHRRSERRHLYWVTFDGVLLHGGSERHLLSYVCAVEGTPEGGWRVRGSAGGAGEMPVRSTPWVNLAGGGWPDSFFAGGRVDDAGRHAARVDLRFADGLTLNDDTDDGVALFITDEIVRMPATIVLLDQAGTEIAAHSAFPGL